jgi:hypothetical protein
MLDNRTPGQVAYEAYGAKRGWAVYGGGPMPTWDEQVPALREAWDAAAAAAIRAAGNGEHVCG